MITMISKKIRGDIKLWKTPYGQQIRLTSMVTMYSVFHNFVFPLMVVLVDHTVFFIFPPDFSRSHDNHKNWVRHNLFFWIGHLGFFSSPVKSVTNYGVAWIWINFYDYMISKKVKGGYKTMKNNVRSTIRQRKKNGNENCLN